MQPIPPEFSGPEHVIAVNLDAPSNIRVAVKDASEYQPAMIRARTDCDTAESTTIACDFNTGLYIDNVSPGTIYLIIQRDDRFSFSGGRIGLMLEGALASALEVIVDVQPAEAACVNGLDDDEDGLVDLDDPGCFLSQDADETDPDVPPACADGVDNDEDGLTDWPDDGDCLAAGGANEEDLCVFDTPVLYVGAGNLSLDVSLDTLGNVAQSTCHDDDGPELVTMVSIDRPSTIYIDSDLFDVYVRTTCDDPDTERLCRRSTERRYGDLWDVDAGHYFVFFEWNNDDLDDQPEDGVVSLSIFTVPLNTACANLEDDDHDGLVDTADSGCRSYRDDDEADQDDEPPACADGFDNDQDGATDWPADSSCIAAGGLWETTPCDQAVPVAFIDDHGAHIQLPSPTGNFFDGTCSAYDTPEHILALELSASADVWFQIEGGDEHDGQTALYARRTCTDHDSEIACARTRSSDPIVLQDLEPGLWYIFIERTNTMRVGITVATHTECRNGRDDDEDGALDSEDSGCRDAMDDNEENPIHAPECADGQDNDADGQIDWPNDSDCAAAGAPSEYPRCELPAEVPVIEVDPGGGRFVVPVTHTRNLLQPSCELFTINGQPHQFPETVFAIPLEGPSTITAVVYDLYGIPMLNSMFLRTRCADPRTEIACQPIFAGWRFGATTENGGTHYLIVEWFSFGTSSVWTVDIDVQSSIPACNDGVDNDDDDLADMLDPGCEDAMDANEADPLFVPACYNEIDDDGDGVVDWPDDDGCAGRGDTRESDPCQFGPQPTRIEPPGGRFAVETHERPTRYSGRCAGLEPGVEQVFEIVLDVPSSVMVETTASTYDTILSIRGNCDDENTELACNDDYEWLDAGLAIDRLEAGTWILFVNGFNGQTGSSQLVVNIDPLE